MKCSKDKDVKIRVFNGAVGRLVIPTSTWAPRTVWALRLPLKKASSCCLPVGKELRSDRGKQEQMNK